MQGGYKTKPPLGCVRNATREDGGRGTARGVSSNATESLGKTGRKRSQNLFTLGKSPNTRKYVQYVSLKNRQSARRTTLRGYGRRPTALLDVTVTK